MKKLFGIIIGGILGGMIVYALAWLAGHFFGPLYYGEDEATRNFKIFLAIFVVSVVSGALLGYRTTRAK